MALGGSLGPSTPGEWKILFSNFSSPVEELGEAVDCALILGRGNDMQAVKMSQAAQGREKASIRATGFCNRRNLGENLGEASHLRHKEGVPCFAVRMRAHQSLDGAFSHDFIS